MNRRNMLCGGMVIALVPTVLRAQISTFSQEFELALRSISDHDFHKRQVPDWQTIQGALAALGVRADQLVDLLNAMDGVFPQVMDRAARDRLSAALADQRQAILVLAQSTQGVILVPVTVRNALGGQADAAAELRHQAAAFGCVGYPYIAASFANEALALRAMRNKRDALEGAKRDADGMLDPLIEKFESAAAIKDGIVSEARAVWSRHVNGAYIGFTSEPRDRDCNGPGGCHPLPPIITRYYAQIGGSYESGAVSSPVATRAGNGPTGPISPYLPSPSLLSGPDEAAARQAGAVRTLNGASTSGRGAELSGRVLREHKGTVTTVRKAILGSTY